MSGRGKCYIREKLLLKIQTVEDIDIDAKLTLNYLEGNKDRK